MAEIKEKVVTTQDYYEEKAVDAAKRVKEGKSLEKVNLEEGIRVRFTKDHGFMKKGTEIKVSRVAYEIYEKNKCIEKID